MKASFSKSKRGLGPCLLFLLSAVVGVARAQMPPTDPERVALGPRVQIGERITPFVADSDWPALRREIESVCAVQGAPCEMESGRAWLDGVTREVRARIARDVGNARARGERERASQLVAECVRTAQSQVPGGLALGCESLADMLRLDTIRASLARAEGLVVGPLPRRVEAWVRVAMRERGASAQALDAAMGVPGAHRAWLRTGPALRWPTRAERDALASVLGPIPRTLLAELDHPPGGPRVPWAAITHARAELVTARAELEQLVDPAARRVETAHLRTVEQAVNGAAVVVRSHARMLLRRAGARPGARARALREALALPVPSPHDTAAEPPKAALVLTPRAGLLPGSDGVVLLAGWDSLEGCAVDVTAPDGLVTFVTLTSSAPRPGGARLLRGTWRADVEGLHRARLRCGETVVAEDAAAVGRRVVGPYRSPVWSEGYEALYSGWIETLFDVPEGASWPALHDLTGDRTRNLLWNHLGRREDAPPTEGGITLSPDCADLATALRAYFAWKLTLPFGYLRCGLTFQGISLCEGAARDGRERGYVGLAVDANPARFADFLQIAAAEVGTTVLREDHWADQAMLYPVPLTMEGLRPGTPYIDPHGHSLVLVRFEDQPDGSRRLLAANAQPGGFLQLTRYWRGSFVFAAGGAHMGAGFKAWRAFRRIGGLASVPTLVEVEFDGPGAPLSFEQAALDADGFHDRMEHLLSPIPRDPRVVYREQIELLHRALETRAHLVDLAETWSRAHVGETIPMPRGDGVFATTGPWEELATICRDLRLRVAMRSLADFPNRVRRAPKLFAIPPNTDVARELDALYASLTTTLTVSFDRGDGQRDVRTLASLLASPDFLEMAYNPNDCAAVRWGLDDSATCTRRAPDEQRARMNDYRVWFRNGYGCD